MCMLKRSLLFNIQIQSMYSQFDSDDSFVDRKPFTPILVTFKEK